MLSPLRRPAARRAAAGLAAGLAIAGVAVGTAGADDDAPTTTAPQAVGGLNPDGPQPAPIGVVQADQSRTLRIFRRARRAADVVPADAMPAVGPQRYGRNPYLARAVSLPDVKGWVVPGDGVVCLVVQDPVDGYGSTCAPTATVARKGLTLGAISPTDASATTLTPDGAVVTAEGDDGQDRPVTPDDAGVVVLDADRTAAIDVATPAGHERTKLYDSHDLRSGALR